MGVEGINHGNYQLYAGQSQSELKTDGVNGDKNVLGSANALKFVETYKRVQFAISHPEIEGAAYLTPDEINEYVGSASAKLSGLKCLFRGKSVMFDIYALMEVIQDIGQKLRDAMREMRKLENQVIYTNIRSQAAIQRSAAKCAMIAGAVMCGIQAAVTLGLSIGQLTKLGSQKNLQTRQGLDVLEDQMQMTQVGGDESLAGKQLDKVVKNTPPELLQHQEGDMLKQASDTRSKINTSEQSVKTADSELDAAKTRLDQAQKNLDDVHSDGYVAAEKTLKDAKTRLDAAKNTPEYQQALSEFNEAKAKHEPNTKGYNEARDKFLESTKEVGEAEKALGKADSDFKKMQQVEGKLTQAAKLQAEIDELGQQLKSAPDGKTELSLKAEQHHRRYELAELKKELAGMGVDEGQLADYGKKIGGLQDGVKVAREGVTKAQTRLDQACEDFQKLTGAEIKGAADLKDPKVVKAENKMVHEALLRDVETAHGNWDSLRQKANNEMRVDGKVSPDTQKALDTAAQEYKLVRAKQVAKSAGMGLDAADYDAVANGATDKYIAASKTCETAGDALSARRAEIVMGAMQGLNQVFGQYSQTFISSWKENISAKATELSADQKLTEDQLDQIKDLMQQAMNLIQKAIDIFQSVISKESQVIDQLSNSFA